MNKSTPTETPDDTAPAHRASERLGPKLRHIRKSMSLSLARVGDGTGLSPSFISMVENGRSDITIRRLIRLVEFYGMSLTDVLDTSLSADTHIVRESERPHVSSPSEGIDIYLLAREADPAMMPQLLDIRPGASLAEPGVHPGEEWIYIVSGELVLQVEDAPVRILRAGDSAYYQATRPHQFKNPSDEVTLRLICVDAPPNL